MTVLKKTFQINKKDFIHAGEASIHVKNLLKSLNTDPKLMRRVAVCGYEGEMNVVMHGGEGFLHVEIDKDKILLEVSDNGPGIDDIELAMQKGYSTASEEHREMGFGAGMGLPNIRQNADRLHIESEKGKGIKIEMIFFMSEIQIPR